MFRNYLLTGFRSLMKTPVASITNLLGLSIGIACCLLTASYVLYELSFDKFYDRADSIYRVLNYQTTAGSAPSRLTPAALARPLAEDFPQVEAAVRVAHISTKFRFEAESLPFGPAIAVDSNFFDVFSLPMRLGDRDRVLRRSGSVVISQRIAKLAFGQENPLGKALTYGKSVVLYVTGVMDDIPANSHLRADYLVSFASLSDIYSSQVRDDDWTNWSFTTYVLLDDTSPEELERRLPEFLARHRGVDSQQDIRLELQPLTKIHTRSGIAWEDAVITPWQKLLLLTIITVMILIIASTNYMSFLIISTSRRLNEVAIRQALGAHSYHLLIQFLTESVILTLAAVLPALVLAELLEPYFRAWSGGGFSLERVGTLRLGMYLLLLTLVVSLLSGIIPSIRAATLGTRALARGRISAVRSPGTVRLRRSVLALQFFISFSLIIFTIVTMQQYAYMQNSYPGFDDSGVLFLPLDQSLAGRYDQVKQELEAQPSIVAAAATSSIPGRGFPQQGYVASVPSGKDTLQCYSMVADPRIADVLQLNVKRGELPDWSNPAERNHSYVVNESLCRKMGWSDPVGLPFRVWDGESGRIVGVVEDFNMKSLRFEIEPLVLRCQDGWYWWLMVRAASGQTAAARDAVASVWEQYDPGVEPQLQSLEQVIDGLYASESRLRSLLSVASGLALFVCCLGLLNLSVVMASQRRRELAIRKVLGASRSQLAYILSKEFLYIALFSAAVAWPLAYVFLSRWLRDFAYRTSINSIPFLSSALIVVLTAAVSVSIQVRRAIRESPGEVLRHE